MEGFLGRKFWALGFVFDYRCGLGQRAQQQMTYDIMVWIWTRPFIFPDKGGGTGDLPAWSMASGWDI